MSVRNANDKAEKMSGSAPATTIPASEPGFQLKVTSASSRTLYLSPKASGKRLPSSLADKEDTPEERRDFLRSLHSGDVVVAGKFVGALRYLGPLSDSGAKVLYAGIELCEQKGSMDGSMHVEIDLESGKERIVSAGAAAELTRQSSGPSTTSTTRRVKKIRYFRCEKEGNCGIMVPASQITNRIEAWTLVKKVNTLHRVNRELGQLCQQLQARQHDTDVREKLFRDLFAIVATRESSLPTAEGSLSVGRNNGYHPRSSTGSAPPMDSTAMFLTPKPMGGKPTLWNSQSDAPTVLVTPDSTIDRPMLMDERSSGSHLSDSSRKAVIQRRASQSSRLPVSPLPPSSEISDSDVDSDVSENPDQALEAAVKRTKKNPSSSDGNSIMKKGSSSISSGAMMSGAIGSKKQATPEDDSSETHVISVDDFPATEDTRLKPTRSLDGNPPDMRSLAGHMQDLDSDAPESPGMGSTEASLRFRRSTSVGSIGSADDRQQRRDHERMIESGGLLSHEADELVARMELSEGSHTFTGHLTEHFVSASLFTHSIGISEMKSFEASDNEHGRTGLTVIDADQPGVASASTSAVSTPATTPALGSVDEAMSPYLKLNASDSMALSTITDGMHQPSLSMVARRGTLCDSKGNALLPSPSDKIGMHPRMNLSMAVETGCSPAIEEIAAGVLADTIAESESESEIELRSRLDTSKLMKLTNLKTVNVMDDSDTEDEVEDEDGHGDDEDDIEDDDENNDERNKHEDRFDGDETGAEQSSGDDAIPTPAPDSPTARDKSQMMRPQLDAIKHRKSNPMPPPVATPISSAADGSASPGDDDPVDPEEEEDHMIEHPPKRRAGDEVGVSAASVSAADSEEEEEEKAGSYHGPGKTTFIVETGPIMSEGRRTSIKFLRTRSTSSHMADSNVPTVLGVKKRAFTDDGDGSARHSMKFSSEMDNKSDEDGMLQGDPLSRVVAAVMAGDDGDDLSKEFDEDLESKEESTRHVEIVDESSPLVTRRTRSGTSAPSVGYNTSGQKTRKRRSRHQKSVSVFVSSKGGSTVQVLDGGELTLDNLRQYNQTKSVEQIMRMHKQRRSSSRTSIPGIRDLKRLADELDKEGSDIGTAVAGSLVDRRPSVHSRETDEKQAVPPDEEIDMLSTVDIVDQETGSVVAVPVDEIDDGTRDRVEDDLLAEVGDEDPPLALDESKLEKTQVVRL